MGERSPPEPGAGPSATRSGAGEATHEPEEIDEDAPATMEDVAELLGKPKKRKTKARRAPKAAQKYNQYFVYNPARLP